MAVRGRVNFSRAANAGQKARRRISGRIPKLNLETEIARNVDALSQSPFEPQFGPAPEFVAPDRPDFQTSRRVPFASELDEAIAGIRGRETATSAGELAGLEGLFEAADPTSRLAEVRKRLETVIGPEALNRAIAGGFGRGPAAAEATAQAGASLTLPILESSFAAKGLANQFKVALEQARFGREQSQQRDLLDSVLNKVNAGISIESLNAQERQVLAQFNLSSAGSESQFNLSGAELQSNREIARSNIGLSTQDRTLALLNQLRTIRTDQARINAGLRSGGGSSGTTGSIFPGGVPKSEGIPGFTTPASRTLATAGTEARFARQATERAATSLASDARLAAAPSFAGGINSPGGTGGVIPTTSSIASRVLTGPPRTSRKPLNPSAASASFF